MADTSLAGKVALITGSGRENGIGAGIAQALSRLGASVIINYVSESSASRALAVCEKIQAAGGKAAVVQGSIVTREGAKAIVQGTLKALDTDKIDILVNNAGGPTNLKHTGLLEMDPEHILADFELNYNGAIYMIQETVPYMPSGGRIINIGAMGSQIYIPAQPAYCAAKAALDHSTRFLAAELGVSKGITVNTIAPGGVLTDPLLNLSDEALQGLKTISMEKSKVAKRMGTVEDISDVVAFVAGGGSRWITGHVFPVGGGLF